MCKKLSAPSVTRLNFIKNQHAAVLFRKFTESFKKLLFRNIYSSYSLNTFNDYCCHITGLQLVFNSFQIIERQKYRIFSFINRCHNLWIIS